LLLVLLLVDESEPDLVVEVGALPAVPVCLSVFDEPTEEEAGLLVLDEPEELVEE